MLAESARREMKGMGPGRYMGMKKVLSTYFLLSSLIEREYLRRYFRPGGRSKHSFTYVDCEIIVKSNMLIRELALIVFL